MSDVFTISDSQVKLPQEIAQAVNKQAAETSLVARLATSTPLTFAGKALPVYEGGVEAGVVGQGDRKPVSKPTAGIRYVTPHKVATIVVVSEEMVRNDPSGMMNKIQADMGAAIGRALDQLVLHGKDAKSGAPVGGQTGLVTAATNSVELVGNDYKSAILSAFDLVGAEHDVTATAFDARIRGTILQTAQDVQFGLPDLSATSVLVAGVPAAFSREVGRSNGAETNVKGIVGNWDQLVYGFSRNITYKRSDQATVVDDAGNSINLWQHNLIGLLVEAELGGAVLDETAFATIKDATEG